MDYTDCLATGLRVLKHGTRHYQDSGEAWALIEYDPPRIPEEDLLNILCAVAFYTGAGGAYQQPGRARYHTKRPRVLVTQSWGWDV